MNLPIFFGLLALLSAGSLWIGKKAGSETKSHEDYFLMGRKLGPFMLIMTLLATQIGGGALMGAAEEAYTYGWRVVFYPLGVALGLVVLGLGYGAKMRKLNLTTIPEIFEKIYQSPRLRRIAALLSIASLFVILVGQGIAARKFFLAVGFSGPTLYILFWLVLVLYTVMGGLRAVVKTDILQTIFILTAFALAIGASFMGHVPSIPEVNPQTFSGGAPWLTWLLMPLLFMLIEQDMGQRCFAARSPRTVSLGAFSAGILLMVVTLVPILFGAIAARMGLQIEQGSSVLITAIQALTNPVVSSVVVCAVLMAIISTSDSLLCSISSNISCDFPKIKNSVFVSQAITFLVGVATLALSFFFDNVVDTLMFSYKLAVSILFVPVTMAIWKKNPRYRSALSAMIVGALSFLIFRFISLPFPPELVILAAAFSSFLISEKVK